jgi:hypothetical protein
VLHGLSDDPSALEKFVSKITIFTVMWQQLLEVMSLNLWMHLQQHNKFFVMLKFTLHYF